jgi:amino acid transporter
MRSHVPSRKISPMSVVTGTPPRLRTGALGLAECIGQSLAGIAPALTPALNVTVVAGLAGIGCWMAYFIGTLGVIVVAASVGILAERHPEAGAFFVYIGRTFGPLAGALAGWSMVCAYLFTAVAVTLSFVIFLANIVHGLGFPFGTAAVWLSMVACTAGVTYSAYRDIKFSARAGLLLQAISIIIILVITALIIRAQGTVIDPVQLDLSRFKYSGVFSALPFVIFSFVGFESAATLAKETANPHRNIPLAVLGSGAFTGVFFTAIAYFMVFGMADDTATLGASSAPFGDVAARAGLRGGSMIVYFAALIGVFACGLASVNAAARLLYSMGKYQFLHSSMGLVHDTHRTPHRAVLVCGAVLLLVCAAMLPAGLLTAYGCAGTFASYGFVVVYLMLCIVAPMDMRRSGEMRPRHVLLGITGTALMLFVIVGSVYPVPEFPYNVLPYAFFAYLIAGGLWFMRLNAKSPQVLASIQHDMEG